MQNRQQANDGQFSTTPSDDEIFDLFRQSGALDLVVDEMDLDDDSLFDTSGIYLPSGLLDFERLVQRQELSSQSPERRIAGESVSKELQLDFGWSERAEGSEKSPRRQAARADLGALVAWAYVQVRETGEAGVVASTDRVILDPGLNAAFIQACWSGGADVGPAKLNWTLMNVRKAGHLSGTTRADRLSLPRELTDRFAFASEFALRSLQEKYYFESQQDLSLDRILCDPTLAAQFDQLAMKLVPGFASLEYRWAAMALRKAMRGANVRKPSEEVPFDMLGRIDSLRSCDVPLSRGIYAFSSNDEAVYIGVAENLRAQITRHLELGGTGVVPEWVVNRTFDNVRVAVCETPSMSASNRERMKAEWVPLIRPRLNYLGRLANYVTGAA